VSTDDLARFAEISGDLADPDVTSRSWPLAGRAADGQQIII
jgi:hypothetical protein